jgi:hypothetical protein
MTSSAMKKPRAFRRRSEAKNALKIIRNCRQLVAMLWLPLASAGALA